MRLLLSVPVCMLGLLASGAAKASCSTWPAGTVTANYLFPKVTYDISHSYHDLNAIDDGGVEAMEQGMKRVGLAVSLQTVRTPYKIQYVTDPRSGTVCAQIASMTMEFGFEENVVYIARELKPYDCIRKDVLNHEYRHVMTNYGILRDYGPQLLQRMQAVVTQLNGVEGPDFPSVDRQMNQIVDQAITAAMQEIETETRRRQAMIDTRAEYERVSVACDGIIQKLVR